MKKTGFTPLEKTADFSRYLSPYKADGGLKPSSLYTAHPGKKEFSNAVKGRSSLTGFTLTEVLISVSILAVITIVSLSIFRILSVTWKYDTKLMLEIQDSRSALEIMHADLTSAFISDNYLTGKGSNLFFLGFKDRVFFIKLENYENENSGLIETGFFYDNNTILRHFQAVPDFDFSTADSKEVICENVVFLNLTYFDGKDWLEEWNSELKNNLPRTVKIVLKTLVDNKENTYESVVYIPSSQK